MKDGLADGLTRVRERVGALQQRNSLHVRVLSLDESDPALGVNSG